MQLPDDDESKAEDPDLWESTSGESKADGRSASEPEPAPISPPVPNSSPIVGVPTQAIEYVPLILHEAGLDVDSTWLHDFYKECGREVTLAYTTLNQMKNWAIVIEASIIAAVVSLSRISGNNQSDTEKAIFFGAAAAYVFVLRFLMRAILCYINLLRWNKLQSSIVALALLPAKRADGLRPTSSSLAERLRDDVDLYYHGWLATVGRWQQLLANLHLGFGLLLAIPLVAVGAGGITFYADPLVRGALVIVVGSTILEFNDFARSGLFDSVEARKRKKAHGKRIRDHFPVPATGSGFMVGWAVVVIVGIVVAMWPAFKRNGRSAEPSPKSMPGVLPPKATVTPPTSSISTDSVRSARVQHRGENGR